MTSEIEIPTWATAVPNYPVHTEPARTGGDILPPFTWQQMQEYFAQFMNAFLAQVAIALGGIEIAGWRPFEFLVAWGENSLQTGDPLNAEDLIGLIAEQLIPGLDATKIVSGTFAQDMITNLIEDLAARLGLDDPLNALNLFNLVPTDLLSHISMSNIGTAITNLLTDPNFLDAAALSGITGWVHDLTGGFGGTGAMSTTANGTARELFGNLIPVSEGQIVPISGKAKWTGLAGTGTPIALGITGYLNGAATTQTTVASHNTTPPTTDWLTLQGSYTVPANVDSLRTRLIVDSTATAGTVSFSNISATKIGAMLQKLIRGTDPGTFLPDDISNLFGGIITNATALLTKVEQAAHDALVSTIGGSFGDDLAAAEDRLNDFLHSLSTLNASNIGTGQVADTFVPGIGDIHDNIVTAVGNLTGGGFDLAKMFEVLTGQTHAVVDAAASVTNTLGRLSILESKVAALPVTAGGSGAGTAAGGLVGANDYDSFERTNATSLGPDWLTYYNGAGKWAIPNGHDAEFIGSGTGNTEFIAIRNLAAIPRSQTAYQRVTLELSSKATRMYDALLGTYNFNGFNDIWLRVSDATTSLANVTGIRVRYGGDGGLIIHQFVNGVGTQLAGLGTGGIPAPGPGANLIGEAGVLADGAPLVIRARVGASIRLQANTTITPVSTSQRWGHGGRAEGHLLPLPGQEKPGGAHYWNGQDQTLL